MCFSASSEILFVRVVFACLPLLVLKIFFKHNFILRRICDCCRKENDRRPLSVYKAGSNSILFTLYTNLTPMINNSPKPR